jgi:hypothetical protein
MLAAKYGADITYGEEIIDHKFLKCFRQENGKSICIPELLPFLTVMPTLSGKRLIFF